MTGRKSNNLKAPGKKSYRNQRPDSPYDCPQRQIDPFQQPNFRLKPEAKKGHWTPEEDETLLHIVKRFGPNHWEKNSIHHSTRNGKQMRARWLCHLKEGVNKSPFTEEEVNTIYYMHDIEKKGWAKIAKRLGNGRTPSWCQNVYHNIVAKNLEIYQKSASRRLSDKEKMAIDSLLTVKHIVENKMDIKMLIE
ncbi:10895_t:CDS:2 [Paraglomus brasilianum]|uniref:10895_t:CDS:1 n=1 Tax=Paraglomus brasilianum TaxID=144538 RepID=A0A9N9A5T6_9GLOM|nr:10895_t:CDS:2 [Paraglomus brasilianum]